METIPRMTPWQIIEEALARKRPHRKVAWLGDQLGVTAQVLTNWKTRKVPPSRFREIADVLGLTVDQLEGMAPLPWEQSSLEWPFRRIDMARFVALDKEQRAYVEGRVLSAIEECEGAVAISDEAEKYRLKPGAGKSSSKRRQA